MTIESTGLDEDERKVARWQTTSLLGFSGAVLCGLLYLVWTALAGDVAETNDSAPAQERRSEPSAAAEHDAVAWSAR